MGIDMRYPLFVVDLEATCDDGSRVPRHEMEIIEIGGVLVDPRSLASMGEFQTFIQPVRNPDLTPFCTGLTSITQRQVDAAPLFPAAIEEMRLFLAGRKVTFCSWGAYDRNQFRQDAEYHKVKLPFDDRRHVNLKVAFSEALGTSKGFGLGAAIRRVGLDFAGTHHRGIDDARNIARLLPWILGREAFEAPAERRNETQRHRGHRDRTHRG